MAIRYNLWPFGIIYGILWYIFPILVCLDQEKSGNTDFQARVLFQPQNREEREPQRPERSEQLRGPHEGGKV
jgi:hypothetical protein